MTATPAYVQAERGYSLQTARRHAVTRIGYFGNNASTRTYKGVGRPGHPATFFPACWKQNMLAQ